MIADWDYWPLMSKEELVGYISDFHKDLHGFRLRLSPELPREELCRTLFNLFEWSNSEDYRKQQEEEAAYYAHLEYLERVEWDEYCASQELTQPPSLAEEIQNMEDKR